MGLFGQVRILYRKTKTGKIIQCNCFECQNTGKCMTLKTLLQLTYVRSPVCTVLTILFIALMVQGMAKAPRSPFTTTYVDDNVEKSQTAMYMGKLNNV